MKVELEIDERVYNSMKNWTELNQIELNGFMVDAITEKYNVERYGDLNDKLGNKKTDAVNTQTREVAVKETENIRQSVITSTADTSDIYTIGNDGEKKEEKKTNRRILKAK